MHFAAVAYVGESTLDPLKYYHNITSNTLLVLESMAKYGVKKLIYSSTCATYGEPEKMPITEETEQKPINPYGKAKKMSKDIILDFSKTSKMTVMILRYFNVIGSDPEGRLGEAPRPEFREHGRISARGITTGLKVCQDYHFYFWMKQNFFTFGASCQGGQLCFKYRGSKPCRRCCRVLGGLADGLSKRGGFGG
ncbi:hypothetical protein LR48_Vigan01g042600 [Vigna angularis]|uniref:NAD-dependent epimerase/dehydratase domain-containing protein n=1 Tax=Phaseolus angularis TaxID=3914 RepID=A0A0L9TK55_PHAAN|nr:hypothetical protein LR48_Vigan01g042600 [Vigna angularis]